MIHDPPWPPRVQPVPKSSPKHSKQRKLHGDDKIVADLAIRLNNRLSADWINRRTRRQRHLAVPPSHVSKPLRSQKVRLDSWMRSHSRYRTEQSIGNVGRGTDRHAGPDVNTRNVGNGPDSVVGDCGVLLSGYEIITTKQAQKISGELEE